MAGRSCPRACWAGALGSTGERRRGRREAARVQCTHSRASRRGVCYTGGAAVRTVKMGPPLCIRSDFPFSTQLSTQAHTPRKRCQMHMLEWDGQWRHAWRTTNSLHVVTYRIATLQAAPPAKGTATGRRDAARPTPVAPLLASKEPLFGWSSCLAENGCSCIIQASCCCATYVLGPGNLWQML